MSEVKTVQAVSKDSRVADVATYVGEKLQGYEFVEELQQFVIDQAIDGESFLTLTDEELKEAGLSALGKRKILLALVEELTKNSASKEEAGMSGQSGSTNIFGYLFASFWSSHSRSSTQASQVEPSKLSPSSSKVLPLQPLQSSGSLRRRQIPKEVLKNQTSNPNPSSRFQDEMEEDEKLK
eukprot:TRINITY_DN1035_c1_g1_i1.p1 TRINITY_DN1035_c1_g1~~TRINITY_DN1035_c1_g1_i1.p1  ORF type:complete len:210 (-),score=39.43 TRINITY_DN1035_c1_g1_i1:100-642(-)